MADPARCRARRHCPRRPAAPHRSRRRGPAGQRMKVALVNPAWTYDGSIYFGCRAAHLPLELGYTRASLEHDGHETLMVDGQLEGQDNAALATRITDFAPEMTVVTTAPTYLFWRCTPPELRVPAEFL